MHWCNAAGSVSTHALAALAQTSDSLFVCVANDSDNVYRIQNELAFFAPQLVVSAFPDHETLPYDSMSPQIDIISERLTALQKLPTQRSGVLVLPVRALMQRLPPRQFIQSSIFTFKVGESFDVSARRLALGTAGYRNVKTVYERGEYAMRGSIFDIFPVGVGQPLRIELLDEEIESLRYFDPETQRTTERVEHVEFLPTKEFPMDEAGISNFRNNWHRELPGAVRDCRDYQDVSDGIAPDGIERYLPLFFNSLETFFDYLPQDVVFVIDDDVDANIDLLKQEYETRYENLRHDPRSPLLHPEKLYLSIDEVRHQWNAYPRIVWVSENMELPHSEELGALKVPDIAVNHRVHDSVKAFRDFLEETDCPVLLVTETLGRHEFVHELLQRHSIVLDSVESFQDFRSSDIRQGITVAPLDRPCVLNDFVVLTEAELFQSHSVAITTKRRKNVVDAELVLRNLTEIEIGDPVVHMDHGVGRYGGLQIFRSSDYPEECMIIEYADSGRIYVPVGSLNSVSRFVGGDEEHVPLHKLQGKSWNRTKVKAFEKIRDVAAELLQLYAMRQTQQAVAFPSISDEYLDFCEQCPFQLTDDQLSATQAVIEDLRKDSPMDRLICGDVGFGEDGSSNASSISRGSKWKASSCSCSYNLASEPASRVVRRSFCVLADCHRPSFAFADYE